MQLFTTAEAARYLRLKERKIYEMVAEGTVPCTKVTGRWLFPKAELDHWLASSVTRPAGMTRPEPAPIVGGSHDPLLEWALRESGCGLATLAVGSEAGFNRFIAGETIAAAMHLHALEDPEADANVAAVAGRSDLQDAVLIAFCRREQGFLLAPGNPLKIRAIDDVIAKRARIAMRPKGAGAQLLLLSLLHRAKAALDALSRRQSGLPDRSRYRAGDPRRPRRYRHRHALGRQFRRARFRADRLGAVRPVDAPARLFSSAVAGADPLSAIGRTRRRARRKWAASIWAPPARCGLWFNGPRCKTAP